MTSTKPAVRSIDLSDGQTFGGGFPHEAFRRLRDLDPVHWHEPTAKTPDGEGFWVVTRHEDVSAVQRDTATYSSDRADGLREWGGTGIKDEPVSGRMLNMTDDDAHHRLRSLVNRGFTPRAVAGLEDELRRRTRVLLDAVGDDTFDVVRSLAREIPSQAICLVLGVPETDRAELLDWLDEGIEADSGSVISRDASRRLREYATELIAHKRTHPDDGIMSSIVEARLDDGSGLDDRELVAFFALLFPAGAETTRSAVAGGVAAFADHPDQFERLSDERSLLPTAVEEIVRWTTPSIYKRRTARHDTELRGVRIAAGDKVTFWEMSANHDERVFDEPFRFDVGRSPNPHVGFGWGPHFCLGAGLARLELKVVFEELVERYRGFEVVGEPEWMPNNRLLGLKRLDVRGVPA